MNWYLDSGKESDVIVSTRIRLARNIKGIPFKQKLSETDINNLLEKMKYITPSLGYGLKFLKIKDMDDITKLALVEKHIISPDIISDRNEEESGILINDEENICIMVNEEDHIRIQIFNSGLDLQNTINLAKEIDKKLDNMLHFCSSKEYGYLTACPSNVGTGLRASVMVHLPALKLTGNISKVLHIVNSFGMTIRGIYGEDSQSKGDMFQISNNQTLGITEEEIINNLENIDSLENLNEEIKIRTQNNIISFCTEISKKNNYKTYINEMKNIMKLENIKRIEKRYFEAFNEKVWKEVLQYKYFRNLKKYNFKQEIKKFLK